MLAKTLPAQIVQVFLQNPYLYNNINNNTVIIIKQMCNNNNNNNNNRALQQVSTIVLGSELDWEVDIGWQVSESCSESMDSELSLTTRISYTWQPAELLSMFDCWTNQVNWMKWMYLLSSLWFTKTSTAAAVIIHSFRQQCHRYSRLFRSNISTLFIWWSAEYEQSHHCSTAIACTMYVVALSTL